MFFDLLLHVDSFLEPLLTGLTVIQNWVRRQSRYRHTEVAVTEADFRSVGHFLPNLSNVQCCGVCATSLRSPLHRLASFNFCTSSSLCLCVEKRAKRIDTLGRTLLVCEKTLFMTCCSTVELAVEPSCIFLLRCVSLPHTPSVISALIPILFDDIRALNCCTQLLKPHTVDGVNI